MTLTTFHSIKALVDDICETVKLIGTGGSMQK